MASLATNEQLILSWRKRQFKARLLKLIAVTAAGFICAWAIAPIVSLNWNHTESLPGKVYAVVHDQKPNKGEMAAFYPPENPYYPKEMWFTKIIVGVPGDVITHQGRDVLINGNLVGEAKATDSGNRRPLDMVNAGIIPAGYYFVWTPHARSYDSRYADIGLIHEKRIIGRAYRLF